MKHLEPRFTADHSTNPVRALAPAFAALAPQMPAIIIPQAALTV